MRRNQKQCIKELEELPEISDKKRKQLLAFGNRKARKNNFIVRIDNNHYFCTNCMKYHDDLFYKIKQIKKCPVCNTKLPVASKRNNLDDKAYFLYELEKNKENELLGRVYYFQRSYNKKTFEVKSELLEVLRYNFDKRVGIRKNDYTSVFAMTIYFDKNRGSGKWRKFVSGYPSWFYIDFFDYPVQRNIKKIIKGTKYQYSCLDKIAKAKNFIGIREYLKFYEDNPEIELLAKAGLFSFIKEIVSEKFIRRNEFLDHMAFVKENKKFIPFWREKQVNLYQAQLSVDLNATDVKLLEKLQRKQYHPKTQFYTTNYLKLGKYLAESNADFKIWEDYMDFITKLNVKITKSVLYPKDLMAEHNKMFNNLQILKDEEYAQDVIDFGKMLEPYNYQNKKYVIRCAKNIEEFHQESTNMNHCVRNYIPKVSHHQTAIFFVRKKEELENSYVTVEIDPVNKVLLQSRAKNNQQPEKEVMSFVKEWCDSRLIDSRTLTFTV